jgi:hypothetical protein
MTIKERIANWLTRGEYSRRGTEATSWREAHAVILADWKAAVERAETAESALAMECRSSQQLVEELNDASEHRKNSEAEAVKYAELSMKALNILYAIQQATDGVKNGTGRKIHRMSTQALEGKEE